MAIDPRQGATNGSTVRVLIVDDNSDAATTTGMWLERCGYQVEVVTDSTECLSHLNSFKPDVLLLDIAMPKVSGYDIARKIRAEPRFETLPIIAISGFADAEHVRRSIDFGCDQHLVKPVDLADLETVIAVEIKRSRSVLSGGPLTTYERSALQKRLGQIAVALGHPRRMTKQSAALIRERAELEDKLAARPGR